MDHLYSGLRASEKSARDIYSLNHFLLWPIRVFRFQKLARGAESLIYGNRVNFDGSSSKLFAMILEMKKVGISVAPQWHAIPHNQQAIQPTDKSVR